MRGGSGYPSRRRNGRPVGRPFASPSFAEPQSTTVTLDSAVPSGSGDLKQPPHAGVAPPGLSFSPVEDDLQSVGRSIHAAFPTRPRHPLRALDVRAMEMASQDQEL